MAKTKHLYTNEKQREYKSINEQMHFEKEILYNIIFDILIFNFS
jgi:hypothetical protein